MLKILSRGWKCGISFSFFALSIYLWNLAATRGQWMRRFLSRSASHSRIFISVSVFINFSFFRYDSFFLKLLQICPYLSQAHTLCPLALQYAELSPKFEAFLQFRHLTYTISDLTFFAILMVTSAFFWLPHLRIQPGVSTLDIQHKRFCYFHALLFLFHVGFCIVHAHADQCQSYVP